MPIEIERDPKNSLIFRITIPDTDLAPTKVPSALRLADAEKLLADLKKVRAGATQSKLVGTPPIDWLQRHAKGHASMAPYSEKRAKAGGTPTHWRVGYKVTFDSPSVAQSFATALGVK